MAQFHRSAIYFLLCFNLLKTSKSFTHYSCGRIHAFSEGDETSFRENFHRYDFCAIPSKRQKPSRIQLSPLSVESSSLLINVDLSVPAIWNKYESLLTLYPHLVDAVTAIIIYFFGTLVSGVITKEEVPPERLLRWMLFGTLDGLLTHDWYLAIDQVGDSIGGDGWGKPLAMIMSDTLVYTPLYCLVFIVTMVRAHIPCPSPNMC